MDAIARPAPLGDPLRWDVMEHPANDRIDPVTIPPLSIVLGFGPMLPILVGGLLAAIDPRAARWPPLVAGVILWSAAILVFIAGVRRGYGFAREAMPSLGSLAGTMWIFMVALIALPAMLVNVSLAVVALLIGYVSVILLDRASALAGEAPRHFARLRPIQMAVGIVGLAALLFAGAG